MPPQAPAGHAHGDASSPGDAESALPSAACLPASPPPGPDACGIEAKRKRMAGPPTPGLCTEPREGARSGPQGGAGGRGSQVVSALGSARGGGSHVVLAWLTLAVGMSKE